MNLDAVVTALVAVENVLLGPRKILLWLWPGESTPRGLGLLVTVLNSLLWSLALAGARSLWRKATT